MIETLDLDLIANLGGDIYTRSIGHHGTRNRLTVVDITTTFLNEVGRSSPTYPASEHFILQPKARGIGTVWELENPTMVYHCIISPHLLLLYLPN